MKRTLFTKRLVRIDPLRTLYNGINEWNVDLTDAIKHKIEAKWQDKLGVSSFDETSSLPKYYVLSMFPYPSGRLHMGHVRVYTISDTMARFHRMNGKNVIHPMGWDAFGLPAENAAIERGVEPASWTRENIDHMRDQLKKLGCSFDWDREVATCDPDYYRWTQYLFLKMNEAGLVYRKKAIVNWDPVDQTVLADEQVDDNGRSWRSGAKVEKKLLNQWFVRTTRFAKSLLDGLDDPILKDWRDITKLQKHWIGECDGVRLEFRLNDPSVDKKSESNVDTISLWTKNPEMISHVAFIAVAPGSILDKAENYASTSTHEEQTKKLKISACNPFTGASLPIFVTDQCEFEPGTDSHLGVPFISESDRLFASEANIPFALTTEEADRVFVNSVNESITQDGVCRIARQQGIGGYPVSSKLRDWLISRQRYWGTPIPMVHCTSCSEPQPLRYSQLPLTLPKVDKLSSRGQSPLLDATDWLKTKCPTCGGEATRETDTMDTFVDSSWYFLRYLDPKNREHPFSRQNARMMPVDLYIGGKEHAVLHLYYARFMSHFLHAYGMLPHREPFKQLLVQGMVMGKSYRLKGSGKYLPIDKVDLTNPKKPVEVGTGQPLVAAWEKMSKSKHNGVDPEDMLKEYGTDTTRLLVLADVAPTSHRNWSKDTFPGILKWQHRLWLTLRNFIEVRSKLDANKDSLPPLSAQFQEQESKLLDSRNFYLKGATFNYSRSYQLSVAISKMQGLTNSLRRASPENVGRGPQFERALAVQLILLAPMAPHFASELWAGFLSAPHRLDWLPGEINWDGGVLEQNWPHVDLSYELDLVCKVNGYEQCSVKLPRHELDTLTHDDALEKALLQAKVQQYTSGRKIVDTLFTLHPSYEATINVVTERDTIKRQLVHEG